MIRSLEQHELGARPELVYHRLQQRELREFIARAGEEQHRSRRRGQMRDALDARLAGRMQRIAEEHQAARTGQRLRSVGPRGHPRAVRFAAREPRQFRIALRRRRPDGLDVRLGVLRLARHRAARSQVWELVAQRRDAALRERLGDVAHERVAHARARAVREHDHRARAPRPDHQGGLARQLDLVDSAHRLAQSMRFSSGEGWRPSISNAARASAATSSSIASAKVGWGSCIARSIPSSIAWSR